MKLNQIIHQEKSAPSAGPVAAAYWAGREEMRGEIVRAIRGAVRSYQPGRYWRRERAAINEILTCSGLLGGEGRDDSSEILDWEF